MNHIKVIKNQQEHEAAIARLLSLMDMDPPRESPESDEIDVLALLVEKYEKEEFPIDIPDPIEAIKFRMDQQGLKKKDLVTFFGSAPKVTEVLNGDRNLSLNMIRRLNHGLRIPAKVLIQTPEQKKATSANIEWNQFPLAEMLKRGYFENFEGKLSDLKEYAAEEVSKFINSVIPGFRHEPPLLRSSAHLRSNDKETNPYALWAWQVKVLQKSNTNKLPVNYEKGTVNLDWMRKIAQLSWSSQGPSLAKEYLGKHGINLVIEPHLPKTYLDGAVCKNTSGNPVVALTLRYDRLDNFWFSLMHELAHIALHLDGNENWYLDNLDDASTDDVELEADALALESLIPKRLWKDVVIFDSNDVRDLAEELEISPCIIAGRARHESGNHRLFGRAFRDKVRNLIS